MEAQNCGCRATQTLGYIKFCPLHAAAGELLDTLKLASLARRHLDKYATASGLLDVLDAIIAKAEGKEDGTMDVVNTAIANAEK